MITDKAMAHLREVAKHVGFSRNEDSVWCGDPISAGDYKGSSTVAVVFADTVKAEEFLQAALPDLISLASGDGEGVELVLRSLDSEWTQGHGAVVIILAVDLAHRDEDGLSVLIQAELREAENEIRPKHEPDILHELKEADNKLRMKYADVPFQVQEIFEEEADDAE